MCTGMEAPVEAGDCTMFNDCSGHGMCLMDGTVLVETLIPLMLVKKALVNVHLVTFSAKRDVKQHN